MKHQQTFSDETLNAFVDNQLVNDDKERIYREMVHDKSLQEQLCRLRTVHELLQDAYQTSLLPPMKPARRIPLSARRMFNIAALLMLFVAGGVIGWLSHAQLYITPFATVADGTAPAATSAMRNVLLHINGDDPQHMAAALVETERLLQDARKSATPLHVELLANEKGIALLSRDNESSAQRIRQIAAEYDNVTFTACAKSLQRIREERGDFRLIPQAQLVNSALDEIVHRMEQEWVYIHV